MVVEWPVFTRTAVVEKLGHLAGPLGPFTSIEEREAEAAQWHEQLTKSDAAVLVDLLYEPVAEAQSEEFFTLELVDALAAIGHADPPWFCAFVGQAFAQRGPNEVLIEVLGRFDGDDAVELLVELSVRDTLSKAEQLSLICSLGELGGERARARLLALHEQLGPDGDPDLLRELGIALGQDR